MLCVQTIGHGLGRRFDIVDYTMIGQKMGRTFEIYGILALRNCGHPGVLVSSGGIDFQG